MSSYSANGTYTPDFNININETYININKPDININDTDINIDKSDINIDETDINIEHVDLPVVSIESILVEPQDYLETFRSRSTYTTKSPPIYPMPTTKPSRNNPNLCCMQ